MLHLKLKSPFLSIKNLNEINLPDFVVLIGKNGVGKTHILAGINRGNISVTELNDSEIEFFNLHSFQMTDQNQRNDNMQLALQTVEAYFQDGSPSDGSPSALVNIVQRVFDETLETNELVVGSDAYNEFVHGFRNAICCTESLSDFPKVHDSKLLNNYCKHIKSAVTNRLNTVDRRRSSSTRSNMDSLSLILLAMRQNKKLPHEITRNDVYSAANYQIGFIQNDINKVFARYKIDQFMWALTEGFSSDDSFKSLISQYRSENQPPWEMLRKYLVLLRESSKDPGLFDFDFSDPENDKLRFHDFKQFKFTTQLTNRTSGDRYPVSSLSSGEQVLMSLFFALFNQSLGRRQPKLLLLDEVDVVLHPSMITSLVSALKRYFVENGTSVIMATHSLTTISLIDEQEIFRVFRGSDGVEVLPTTKPEAISELSEGIATIETGLKISSSVATVTILTEGNNFLHLKKWASLFFPDEVDVFSDLPAATGKDQLKAYGQLLGKMDLNSHFLIVWDCDAKSTADKLARELTERSKVTAFALEKRDNEVVHNGIENKYDMATLKPFLSKITPPMNKPIMYSFDKAMKTEFAESIFSSGTEKEFRNFDDLKSIVENILLTKTKQ